jgi:hypothetical protein
MGGGRWDTGSYTRSASARAACGKKDFEYTESEEAKTKVHSNLDPRRINKKPFQKLESRDSDEHPNSNAIFMSFDVTGSNLQNAQVAQKKLPNLMEMLIRYIDDPQVLIAANDDDEYVGERALQISDFESDNRVDEHLRNIILLGQGGGNDHESYDLVLYAAAYRTEIDCFEKRGKKGYFFMYADEPVPTHLEASAVKMAFGGQADEGRVAITKVIADLKKMYNVFIIWPQNGYKHARKQYETLFGKECVVTLQHPNLICELVGSLVGIMEEKISEKDVVHELVKFWATPAAAAEVKTAVHGYLVARG